MDSTRRLLSLKRWKSGESGMALVEILIAVTILAIAATAYLGALSTSIMAIAKEDRRTTAKSLALSQVHHTRSQSFSAAPFAYPVLTPIPQGYSVSSSATSITGKDDNIQRVTVTVQYLGREITVLEDFKVNR